MWRLADCLEMLRERSVLYQLIHNDEQITFESERDGDRWSVPLPDGSTHIITARRLSAGEIEVTKVQSTGADQTFRALVAQTDKGTEVAWGGAVYVFAPADGRQPIKRSSNSGTLTSPMAGIVVDL